MRRTTKRLLAAVFVSVTSTALVTVAFSNPAVADPIPATNWEPITWPASGGMVTQLDGGVTIGCTAASPMFWSLDADGVETQEQAQVSGYYGDTCNNLAVVGNDGTVYIWVSSTWVKQIRAYKNDALVWSYSISCGSGVTPQDMVMGTDGNLYVATTGNGSSCPPRQLIKMSPTVETGTTNPEDVDIIAMDSPDPVPGGLAAYSEGIAVRRAGSVQFISYSGSSSGQHTFSASPNYYGDLNAVVDSGRVFVVTQGNSTQKTGCTYPNSAGGQIHAIEIGGGVWAQPPTMSPCSYVYELRPTYSGGVVARMFVQEFGVGTHELLVAYDKMGKELWQTELDSSYAYEGTSFAVDLNGNVAVQRNVRVSQGGYQFPEIQFALLNGNTGQALPGTQIALRGDSSTSNGPSYMWPGDPRIYIAEGTLYVSAYQCTTWPNGCNVSSAKLYAFTVPGLEMDYPRGAILRYDEPWLDYVALGDSFSSGEGVPDFESPSDANGCHRSEKAYAKSLDRNPALRLDLTFVACSGATTSDVEEGMNGEEGQLNALDSDTDVVTITIGGNDIGFEAFVQACLFLDCGDTEVNGSFFQFIAFELGDELEAIYEGIADAAPNAKVYVLGYPHLLPPTISGQQCEQTDGWMWALNNLVDAAALFGLENPDGVEFNASEVAAARLLVVELNEKIEEVVDSLGNSDFIYIDPLIEGSPFMAHELCSTTPYFNGLVVSDPEYSFHPNAQGQDAYRQLIMSAILP